MKRRLAALCTIPLLLLVAGCSQVQDAASDAANAAGDAANEVKSEIATATAGEVQRQACSLVEDGLVSAQEAEILSTLVSSAESVGLPAEIITPLKDIAEAGDQVPGEAVTALREECGTS